VTSAPPRLALALAAALLAAAACSNPPPSPVIGTSGVAGSAPMSGGGGAGSGAAGVSAGAAGATGAAGVAAGAAGTPAGVAGAGASDGGAGAVASDGAAADSSTGVADPGTVGDGDFTIMPPYNAAPELTEGPSVPHGVVHPFTIASTESPIFPGVTGAYTRQGWLYVPAQYVKGTAAPFIIAQDGRDYLTRLPPILDNMIAAKRLPAMLAIMVMAGPGDGPGSERGFEYDTVSDAYTSWVESTVLPKMMTMFGVAFTTNPEGRASMGGSSGGAAAFTMGWLHPELYRRILMYSGTLVDQGPTPAYPQGAWEYPDHLIADTPGKPLRVHMEAAQMDLGVTNTEASMHNWLIANQKAAAALKMQGYHYHFDYAMGAQHNDTNVVAATLPAALEWLWRGYPVD
jgi:iron(III)-enterobactin esterase